MAHSQRPHVSWGPALRQSCCSLTVVPGQATKRRSVRPFGRITAAPSARFEPASERRAEALYRLRHDDLAGLLHEMARFRKFERRRTIANDLTQCPHYGRPEYRVLRAHCHEAFSSPGFRPEVSRATGESGAVRIWTVRHQVRKPA